MGVPGSVNALLAAGGPTQYKVERSLRFNSSDSAYLSRTPPTAGNRKTWTWSGWVKRCETGTASKYIFATTNTAGLSAAYLYFNDNNLRYWDRRSSGDGLILVTNAVFRDSSAWYHIVLAVDYANATTANRAKLYVNGIEQTYSTASYPSTTEDSYVNAIVTHYIAPGTAYFDGYLADIHFIDGQALTPSDFAETNATTGQWVPKAYSGTYGTNGFQLKFADNSNNTATTLGKDSAGSNNWTPNNLSVTAGAGNDSLVDTPTSYGTDTGAGGEVRGNYATLNPLDKHSEMTLANGNLDASVASPSNWRVVRATIGIVTGKWYWEVTCVGTYTCIGINLASAVLNDSVDPNKSYAYCFDGVTRTGTLPNPSYGGSFGNGDIIGVAYDADNGTLAFYKNGTSLGQAFSGIPANTWFPYVTHYTSSGSYFNFGQRPFAYQTPGTNRPASTYKALVDTNLTAPVVAKSSDYFQTVLYTGNGSTQTISGLGFSPDLVWIKSRSLAYAHNLGDTVRGVNNTLSSNSTGAENYAGSGDITAFNSDGFSIRQTSNWEISANSQTYAAWCWDAGSAAASTNNSGSIQSTVKVNATSGFSVVTYTGTGANATVGHGLGVAPSFVILKSRTTPSTTGHWFCYHSELGNTKAIFLNLTNAAGTSSTYWNNTSPTSTVFSISTEPAINQSTITYVAYCFAPVAGYSSFGSYVGNGSADGPFVYTGFRPKWVMIKASSSTGDWYIIDTLRDTYNLSGKSLQANTSNAEPSIGGSFSMTDDILSNGFKLRDGGSGSNGSSVTYVYAAFAENPFQYARAR